MVELGCRGAVVLSTCNRTEVYLSLGEGQDLDPRVLLCQAAGISSGAFDHAFITRWGVDCARHLMEVACGLRSQILGEDQILTQVKAAVALAREAGSADGVLETLFRTAAACGKSAKAGGRLSGVPTSAAHRAVEVFAGAAGNTGGKVRPGHRQRGDGPSGCGTAAGGGLPGMRHPADLPPRGDGGACRMLCSAL